MSDTMTRRTLLCTIGSTAVITACQGGKDSGYDEVDYSETVDPTAWASGGTAAMGDSASYPDPFTSAAISCALLASTTEGPCTTTSSEERVDVSEDWDGLPVRLVLKLIDEDCTPLTGATVKIWHTNFEGSYSGQTPNNNMCLSDQDYSAQAFFRGAQVSDDDGIVTFDTCFPGWYSGRAVHIHLQVDGGVVTQIFFPESVTEGIFSNHSTYKSFGQPDTTFSNDNIMSGIDSTEWSNHVVDVLQMSDGVMLASKVVAVV